MRPKYTYKEVYLGVHSSFVDKISRWEEEDFDKFALDVISKYNDVLIAEEKLKFINKKMYEINQKGYDRDN
jgi:hypothetical protein